MYTRNTREKNRQFGKKPTKQNKHESRCWYYFQPFSNSASGSSQTEKINSSKFIEIPPQPKNLTKMPHNLFWSYLFFILSQSMRRNWMNYGVVCLSLTHGVHVVSTLARSVLVSHCRHVPRRVRLPSALPVTSRAISCPARVPRG